MIILELITAVYITVGPFFLNTTNNISTLVFKVIPFFLGVVLAVDAFYRFGFIINI